MRSVTRPKGHKLDELTIPYLAKEMVASLEQGKEEFAEIQKGINLMTENVKKIQHNLKEGKKFLIF